MDGEADKASGFGVVLLDGNTVEIKIGETVLGIGVAGIGGGAHPTDRFLVIARGAGARIIERGKVELADGIALLGGEEIPTEGFAQILGDALAVLIEGSEVIFSGRMML